MPLLEVSDIHVSHGQIEALHGISFKVEVAECVALLGANGAGKTTTLRAISALTRAGRGSIRFDGEAIEAVRAESIAALGVAHVPEGRRCFARLSVRENLELGAYLHPDQTASGMEKVFGLFPQLADRQRQRAGTLSGGEQQMLAMGRALMAQPRLLLLDEPSMGIAPALQDRIYEQIARINQAGTTILLVEQNAKRALQVADRGYVLERGRIVISGNAEQLRADPAVQKAYLGG
jgi:branched-chain amino acid transport system ATP-binding protein